jgi:hypothetical protein
MEPHFMHYENIPAIRLDDLHVTLLAGEFLNSVSPVKVYSPLMGIELNAINDTTCFLPLDPKFEHGILPLIGNIEIANEVIDISTLLYLPCGQSKIPVRLQKSSRALIIGGEPFKEDILIWWNFVARTKEEMIKAATDWNNHAAFGEIEGYQGERLVPPPCQ